MVAIFVAVFLTLIDLLLAGLTRVLQPDIRHEVATRVVHTVLLASTTVLLLEGHGSCPCLSVSTTLNRTGINLDRIDTIDRIHRFLVHLGQTAGLVLRQVDRSLSFLSN